MRLLLATGGSPHSSVALSYATQLASLVREPPTVLIALEGRGDRDHGNRIRHRAESLLLPQFADVRFLIREGKAAREILEEANRRPYDLVLLGQAQPHRATTRLVGSVVTRVADRLACPLLVVTGNSRPLHHWLICDSGAPHPALLDGLLDGPLLPLTSTAGQVVYMHVMSQISAGPGVQGETLQADARELIGQGTPEGLLLARGVERLSRPGVTVTPQIRHGFVVDEILTEARQQDVDLVAIGAHRRFGWPHYLLADLARNIINRIDRPLLIVR